MRPNILCEGLGIVNQDARPGCKCFGFNVLRTATSGDGGTRGGHSRVKAASADGAARCRAIRLRAMGR